MENVTPTTEENTVNSVDTANEGSILDPNNLYKMAMEYRANKAQETQVANTEEGQNGSAEQPIAEGEATNATAENVAQEEEAETSAQDTPIATEQSNEFNPAAAFSDIFQPDAADSATEVPSDERAPANEWQTKYEELSNQYAEAEKKANAIASNPILSLLLAEDNTQQAILQISNLLPIDLSGIPDEELYISSLLNILGDKATPEDREEAEQKWENLGNIDKAIAINQIKGEVAHINKEREQRLQELREGAKLAKADTAPKQDPKNVSLIKDAENYIDTLVGKNLIAGVTLTEQKAQQVKQIIAKIGNDASAVANAAIATLVANDLGRVLKQTANQTKQALLKDATLSNIQSSRPQGDGLSTQPIDQKAEQKALIAKQAEERINKFFGFSS